MNAHDRQTLADMRAYEARNQFWLRVILAEVAISLALTIVDAWQKGMVPGQ